MNEILASLIENFNAFDYLVIVIIAVSGLYGVMRGFIKEAVTLTAWFLATWFAYVYASDLSIYLESHIATQSLRVAVIVVAIFAVVLSASALIRSFIRWLIDRVGLSGFDHVLGLLFGVLRGILLAMLLIILLDSLGFSSDQWWKNSVTIGRLSTWMNIIPDHVPETVMHMYKDAKGMVGAI